MTAAKADLSNAKETVAETKKSIKEAVSEKIDDTKEAISDAKFNAEMKVKGAIRSNLKETTEQLKKNS